MDARVWTFAFLAIFCLSSKINFVVSSNDGFYIVDSKLPLENIELYDINLLKRVRRDTVTSESVTSTSIVTNNNNNTAKIIPSNTTSVNTMITTTNTNSTLVPKIENKKATSILKPDSPIAIPANSTKLDSIAKKNVGVNNTDIKPHKDCEPGTNSSSTYCVSNPITVDEADNYNLKEFSEPQEDLFADHNITNVKSDTHDYYNSTLITNAGNFDDFWKSMINGGKAVITQGLSQSHRRASTVNLSFAFPFYGYKIRNVTITTGGFLYMGEYIHKWLAATQFIAPLMANFDISLHNESFVKHIDNGTSFTVIWENVKLQDEEHEGKFTFAAHLKSNGDITFAYKSVPIPIESIGSDNHPVKIGLSDAFLIDKVFFSTRRKTIYEYHRVNFLDHPIGDKSLLHLVTLPSCPQYETCSSCVEHQTKFDCAWCPSVRRCSHGNDRLHQEWLLKNCEDSKLTTLVQCIVTKPTNTTTAEAIDIKNSSLILNKNFSQTSYQLIPQESEGRPTAVAIGVITLITSIAILSWFIYAYRNPHTYSGQFLIKYRPSQWSWRRGEARYTAATIHM